ncbi:MULTISPECIES: heat shock protein HspQ [unclassified Sphingobium]|uniref:heat shock protein HspQ n=1 Tax=unclassified Sphingobium TaxID=2611147 RepID=UPI0022244285|nr:MULTISPECIES: heat shock protein HspQ [unclassified Sphingobium]MCW2367116.1 heat shock protein HspQ [Sphingobium sp. B7D2B]MCW2368823.1 heat shock protein HspQ [Sphingobium sp. B11D3D]
MNQAQARKSFSSVTHIPTISAAHRVSHAHFGIGEKVRHRLLGFRGVVFDIDPVFSNSEEWYEAIPEAMRPERDQPFYHLFADNGEATYVAYVSQQNLVADGTDEPIDHPAVTALFGEHRGGHYALDPSYWH